MNKKHIAIILLVVFLVPVGISIGTHTATEVADHEEGDLSDWDSTACGWSASQTQAADGTSWSARHSGDVACGTNSWMDKSVTASDYGQVEFWVYPDTTSQDTRGFDYTYSNGGRGNTGNYLVDLRMDNGNIIDDSGGSGDTGIDLPNQKWTKVIALVDYANNDYDLVVEDASGNTIGTKDNIPFGESHSQGDTFSISNTDDTDPVFFDELYAYGTVQSQAHNTITGTVTNSRTGNAVQNANVRVFYTNGTLVTSTTTDSNGDYSVGVDDGQYFFDYNKGTAYIDRQILNTVSSDETINVDLQPRRVVYTDASPRANEYVRNRTSGAFDLSINVSDPSGNQVNTTIFWFNESTDEFENIHQVNDWTDDLSIDIAFPEDANKGTNVWFASTEATRGTFNSSANSPTNGYQFETPGNISIRDVPDPSTELTDAEITATIVGLSSGFQETRTTTSTGSMTWDGEIDLNDIPKEDYRIELESTDGEMYRDAILGLNADRVTDLNIAIMVDETTFNNNDGWYAQEFQLNDNTGSWSPENVMLFLQQNVDGSYQEVGGDLFGNQNSAVIDVNDTTEYRLLLYHLQRGDSRSVGTFKADRDLSTEVVTINVDSVAPPPTEDNDEGYEILAFLLNVESSDPSLRVTFSDPEELTYDFNFQIYERGNQTNVLVPDDGAAHLGNATFTYDVSVNQTRTSWVVDWNATRDGELINGTIVVTGERLDPGVPINTNARHGVAFLSILLVGGVVGGGARSDLGAVVVALMGGFFVFIGWMPSVVGMSVIVFALFVAILFNARIRGQTP